MTTTRPHRTMKHTDELGYRHLLETFAQAVWEADASGLPVAGSPAWAALTGQSANDGTGRGWLDAVHPDDRRQAEEAWRRALQTGHVYRCEYRVRTADHSWAWTLAHAAPVMGPSGQPVKWLGMNVDISRRKAAMASVADAAREKSEFIAILAHELRNPLAPLRSGIEVLLRESATAEAKARALAMVSRQAFHISRLVEDLVDASRISAGHLQIHARPMRLADVIAPALEAIQPATSAKKQELVVEGLDETDAVVDADAIRLCQAFVNILNNSTKFSPRGSPILVKVARNAANQVSVTLRDRGPAILESDVPKIFELFVQSARHDRGDGLGIGLALANAIVRLHGGKVAARNAAMGAGAGVGLGASASTGTGTEFEVVLPALNFEGRLADTAPRATDDADWRTLRILVVDDNVEAAELLGLLLEMAGHTIRIAHGGAEALLEVPTFLPDVVFMDVGMPVVDGLEATRRIRRLDLAVRPFIVALTGWNQAADREAGRAAGSDLHLAKPAEFETIEMALRAAIAAQSAAPAARSA